MNKIDIIQAIKKETGFAKTEAAAVVDLFFNKMAEALVAGEKVELRGLWAIYTKDYSGYTGQNPKTGKKVMVQSKKLPFFKCGKDLKERVDILDVCKRSFVRSKK
jgi:integration host factor subunit beta